MELTKQTSGSATRIVIAACAAVLIVAAVWWMLRPPTPRAVASKYLAAWRDGDEQARRELTTPESLALEDRLTRIIGQMPRAISYKVGESTVEGDRAQVRIHGRVEWQSGEGSGLAVTASLDMVLVKVEGRWRVDSIATLESVAREFGLVGEVLIELIRRWQTPPSEPGW